MAVLSHGDDGKVFGTDGEMAIKKLVEPLKNCKTLGGKPKLFFVQVCVKTRINNGSLVVVKVLYCWWHQNGIEPKSLACFRKVPLHMWAHVNPENREMPN